MPVLATRTTRCRFQSVGLLFLLGLCLSSLPTNSDALLMDATAYNDMGIVQQSKGDLDGAIQNYREALRLKPDFPEAMYNLGVALQAKGDLDSAIAQYRAVLTLTPDEPDVYGNLGNALKAKGNLDAAVEAYRTALRLDPDHPSIHYNLAIALKAKGIWPAPLRNIAKRSGYSQTT